MYTRTDYLNQKCTHRQFCAQFVNNGVAEKVMAHFGIDRLLKSTDEHLNDLPLKEWDALCGFQWKIIGGQEVAVKQPHTAWDIAPIDAKLLEETGAGISNSTLNCIYKEAGKQIIEEYKSSN